MLTLGKNFISVKNQRTESKNQQTQIVIQSRNQNVKLYISQKKNKKGLCKILWKEITKLVTALRQSEPLSKFIN
jgi:hypothetical protein